VLLWGVGCAALPWSCTSWPIAARGLGALAMALAAAGMLRRDGRFARGQTRRLALRADGGWILQVAGAAIELELRRATRCASIGWVLEFRSTSDRRRYRLWLDALACEPESLRFMARHLTAVRSSGPVAG
jgi:hypothetical protein